jgi:SAM-dependent methyltransferase
LNERYVREWLGAMYTGGFVDYDADAETYWLPREHAGFLTRAAAANNLASLCQYFGQLGAVEDSVVACFKNGGGVPYEEFKRFHEIMAEDSGQSVLPVLLDQIIPLVPGLKERLFEGIDVLDVGCGVGLALIMMAKTFPNSRFTGYDFSKEAITRARAEAARHGLTNIRFEVQDAATIDEADAYDFIATFDAIHDQAKPAVVLSNIHRALHEDGVYLMQDIRACSHVHGNSDHPIGPLLYTVSCMHCMTVSLAYGGEGLGTMWGEELALQMIRDAGFRSTRIEQLSHDIQNQYYINRKSE